MKSTVDTVNCKTVFIAPHPPHPPHTLYTATRRPSGHSTSPTTLSGTSITSTYRHRRGASSNRLLLSSSCLSPHIRPYFAQLSTAVAFPTAAVHSRHVLHDQLPSWTAVQQQSNSARPLAADNRLGAKGYSSVRFKFCQAPPVPRYTCTHDT